MLESQNRKISPSIYSSQGTIKFISHPPPSYSKRKCWPFWKNWNHFTYYAMRLMPRWISCPLADFEQREQCSLIERYCPCITSHSPYNLVNQSLSPSSTEPFHSLYRVRVVAKKNISQRRYESAAVYDEMQVWVNEEKSAWERRTDWWERRVRQRDGAVDRKRRLRQHTHTHTLQYHTT